VNCRVAMAVLEAMATERLQDNAHDVGAYLADG
jgi:4-aminobutyrate aminotransferase-like enzyme